ncbi:outer membrane protein assembly factor BamE [Pseudoxanthomonas sp.]|uniref:outer membrane protein assembly factor BamE n=1 Tax=Pseudoxanthomonas sp. TaxID=1871049 RepID=UPI00258AA954|nr:outer membrane protein assembly factor BamE [Pseudoxanthomonas sp.]MCR6686914.1 outer membrane protein assembly factor BamE [Pseudoxanthomonas sp.]
MPSFRLLLIAPLSLALAGCGILYKQPIYQGNLMEKEAVDQLRPGLSKQQVAGLLGTPSVADPFHAQRWDYSASQRTNRRGDVEIKTLTLHFENDSLARWEGDYFPEQDEELARNSIRQFGPNLVKEKDKRGGR